ncbi:hypothetical protein GCM10010264_64710 [Streptomyces globisporus]|nr:hypothetical protein GCM10010264_64710 [Streptomyces globisporus]
MSSLKFWASEVSGALVESGEQPTFARSWFTRASTSLRAEASVGEGLGFLLGGGAAEVFGGAGALLDGAELFSGAVVGAFDFFDGVAAGFFDVEGAADFDGALEVFEGEGVLDGVFDGVALGASGRSLPRPAGEEDRSAGAVELPPCVSRSGAPPVRTWSAAVVLPVVYESPPGIRPEATATAPTATAADTPRSPVRIGTADFFRRVPRRREAAPAAGSSAAGPAADRRWRPMRCAFLILRTPPATSRDCPVC